MTARKTGGKAGRKTAIYSCKYHTGAKPKEVPLDHMPMIEEKTLQAEVEKQVNDYIRHLSGDRDVLDSAIQKRMALMKPIESKIRDFGEKFLKQEEASWEGYSGLWK